MAETARKTERFDDVVIGTGQAGKPLARALADAGRRVAIVERDHVGGSCINHGCTPTKTMVASARVAWLARRAAEYGVDVGPVEVDLARVVARKREIVEMFRGGSERGLERSKVELVRGEASFEGPKTIAVRPTRGGSPRRLEAGRVFVNTGTRAHRPPIDGLDGVPALDNVSIMELEELPEHLLVLGGGYIGLEFGQMFRRFGSRVTIVHRGKQLLAREDEDIADALADILREDGVELLLESEASAVAKKSDGTLELTVEGAGGKRTLRGSHLLVATGRVPNTDALNLEAAGIETDEGGFIPVNDRLETEVPGIWALGDVKGGPAFTHISYDDFRIVNTNLIEGGDATTHGRMVPYTVFTDPQLGRIGMGEREARERHGADRVRVFTMPMENVARAIEFGETRGLMKAIVHRDTEQILGCAVLGLEGGEVASVLQVAMMGRVPYTAIKEGVFSHPTLAESLNNLFS